MSNTIVTEIHFVRNHNTSASRAKSQCIASVVFATSKAMIFVVFLIICELFFAAVYAFKYREPTTVFRTSVSTNAKFVFHIFFSTICVLVIQECFVPQVCIVCRWYNPIIIYAMFNKCTMHLSYGNLWMTATPAVTSTARPFRR